MEKGSGRADVGDRAAMLFSFGLRLLLRWVCDISESLQVETLSKKKMKRKQGLSKFCTKRFHGAVNVPL